MKTRAIVSLGKFTDKSCIPDNNPADMIGAKKGKVYVVTWWIC